MHYPSHHNAKDPSKPTITPVGKALQIYFEFPLKIGDSYENPAWGDYSLSCIFCPIFEDLQIYELDIISKTHT